MALTPETDNPFDADSAASAMAFRSLIDGIQDGSLGYVDPADAVKLSGDAARNPYVAAEVLGAPGVPMDPAGVAATVASVCGHAAGLLQSESAARAAEERSAEDAFARRAAEFSAAGMDGAAVERAYGDAAMGDTYALDCARAAYYLV